MRQPVWIIPALKIIVCEVALAEHDVLGEQNDAVARAPVAQETEEVDEVGIQLLATAECEAQNGGEAQKRPDEARDTGEGAGKLLARDGGAVDGDDVGVDAAEHEQAQEELGEAARVQHVLDQEAESLVLVRVFPGGFVV